MNAQRMPPILSMRQLAWHIGVPSDRLKEIADSIRQDRGSHYRHFALKTGPDKVRHIDHPAAELLDVQRRIVRNVLAPLGFGDAAHGGIRGRSPASNAAVHRGKRCVVKLDVKSFFPSVKHNRVYRMFREELGFGKDVSRLLTRLVTVRGALPQGAATSLAVANHFAIPVDEGLKPSVERHGLTYSRFVDDLTISGDSPKFLIGQATRLLKKRGLNIAPEKLKVCGRGKAQEVTGLLVNDADRLTISRHYRDAVRSAIHKLRNAERDDWPTQIASIEGKIAYIARFNPGPAGRLRRYLAEVIKVG